MHINNLGDNIRSAEWWLERPTYLALGLYASGFIAQNTYFSGFRFVSTDILDKNYLLTGSLCVSSMALTYFFVVRTAKNIWRNPSYLAVEFRDRDPRLVRVWDLLLCVSNFCLAVMVMTTFTTINAPSLLWVGLISAFCFWSETTRAGPLLGAHIVLRAALIAYWTMDIERHFVISVYVATTSAALLWAMHVYERWELPSATVEFIAIVSSCCILYGYSLHPVIKQAYGGGELALRNIAYLDPSKKLFDPTYKYTSMIGSILHATDKTLYLSSGDTLIFVQRENIISIGPIPLSLGPLPAGVVARCQPSPPI